MDVVGSLRRALTGPHPLALRCLIDVVCFFGVLTLGAFAKSWALDVGVGTAKTTIDFNTIILAVISLIGTIYLAKINSRSAKTADSAEKTKESQVEATGVLKEVHTAVNTNYQAMKAEVARLTDIVMGLTKDKSTLTQQVRGAELDKAVADTKLLAAAEQRPPAVPTPVMNPTPVPVKETP